MVQNTISTDTETLESNETLASSVIENYTPHAVTVFGEDDSIIAEYAPGGHIARAEEDEEKVGEIDLPNGAHVPVLETHYGKPVDLPDPEDGHYLIVSPLTLVAAKDTGRPFHDLLIPTHLVRDGEGQIIGCRALTFYE